MANVYIYVLIDPRTDEVRYVGQALNAESRYAGHLNDGTCVDSHKARWIRKLLNLGLLPELEVIDKVLGEDANLAECAWIYHYRYELRMKLTNGTEGGEGLVNPSQETLANISKYHADVSGTKNPFYGMNHTTESKEKLRQAHIGRIWPGDVVQKRANSNRGKKRSAETRAKMSKSRKGMNKGKPSFFKGRNHTEESKLKQRESAIHAWKVRKCGVDMQGEL